MDPFSDSFYREPAPRVEDSLDCEQRLYQSLKWEVLSDVEDPTDSILRRFTPDGNHLIAFSKDMQAVRCFELRDSLVSCDRFIFQRLFKPVWESRLCVASGMELLCKDFCLFFADNLMLLTASVPSPAIFPQSLPRYPRTLSSYSRIEDITFYLLDLKDGSVLDRLSFKTDFILLSHNGGVGLCGDLLAILSLQHQVIYLYRIAEKRLKYERQISDLLDPGEVPQWDRILELRRFDGFHQRLHAYLYLQIESKPLFYRLRDCLQRYCFWRLQFLDQDTLLLRLVPEQMLTHGLEPNRLTNSYFALWSISRKTVLGFWHEGSKGFSDFIDTNIHKLRYAGTWEEQVGLPSKAVHQGNCLQERSRIKLTYEFMCENSSSSSR